MEIPMAGSMVYQMALNLVASMVLMKDYKMADSMVYLKVMS